MKKLNCKPFADMILTDAEIAIRNSGYDMERNRFVILSAGDNHASEVYMRGKLADCKRCGIVAEVVRVKTEEGLHRKIKAYNECDEVAGIIVQLPLPDGWNEIKAVRAVSPEKDIDGFNRPYTEFVPCTPGGILDIMNRVYYEDGIRGKTALIAGYGHVGEPLADLLAKKGCTVTVMTSKTKNKLDLLEAHHDIFVSCVGKANVFAARNVNADLLIDVGMNRDDNGKLCGDIFTNPEEFNFFGAAEASYSSTGKEKMVTPVPGGVGLMTRAFVIYNLCQAILKRNTK